MEEIIQQQNIQITVSDYQEKVMKLNINYIQFINLILFLFSILFHFKIFNFQPKSAIFERKSRKR